MKLQESDVATKEVLAWQGLHLIHFRFSSCSQKTRIFLNLKGIEWQSHHLNLAKQENYEDWFLGVNPRGLVPVLVHDGVVHIESNDIIQYLEQSIDGPKLVPEPLRSSIEAGLKEEDDLHLDLRALTMGFLSPKALVKKKPALIDNYENNVGTVQGAPDRRKAIEVRFWKEFAQQGITEEQALTAARNFAAVYRRLEKSLAQHKYLAGNAITLLDIAWYIYTHRLMAAGYPFTKLHPRVTNWYQRLNGRREFSKEVAQPLLMVAAIKLMQAMQKLQGKTLEDVMRRGGLTTETA